METADWAVLLIPGIAELADRAARSVAAERQGITEYDDMHQEARILLARKARMIRECLADAGLGRGVVYYRLRQDLVDHLKTDVSRSNRHVPLPTLEVAA